MRSSQVVKGIAATSAGVQLMGMCKNLEPQLTPCRLTSQVGLVLRLSHIGVPLFASAVEVEFLAKTAELLG